MSVEVLIDANILVYAHTLQDARKQNLAVAELGTLARTGAGAVSTQTLAEFFVTVSSPRKFRRPLPLAEATRAVQHVVANFAVVDVTPQVVLEAVRGVRDHSMSYWDAQVWATAKLNQIPVIYTEDGPTGATIEGVRYVNPFAGPTIFVVKEEPLIPYGTQPRHPPAKRRVRR